MWVMATQWHVYPTHGTYVQHYHSGTFSRHLLCVQVTLVHRQWMLNVHWALNTCLEHHQIRRGMTEQSIYLLNTETRFVHVACMRPTCNCSWDTMMNPKTANTHHKDGCSRAEAS